MFNYIFQKKRLIKINNLFFKKNYFIGSMLSIILTILSFSLLLINNYLSNTLIKNLIIILGILQILIQITFFMHLNYSTKKILFWNILLLIFTCIIIMILFIGSIYIMYSLNSHMMF